MATDLIFDFFGTLVGYSPGTVNGVRYSRTHQVLLNCGFSVEYEVMISRFDATCQRLEADADATRSSPGTGSEEVYMEIRLARPEEGAALQAVHLRTWQATYQGLLPDAVFGERLQQHRQVDWEARVRQQEGNGGGVLALIEGNTIAGLCQYGPTEDDDLDPARVGEVHRLYVAPAYQGRGGGRLLLDAAGEALRRAGKEAATLWVFEADGRARAFYEHLGWRPDGARQQQAFPDIRYRLALVVSGAMSRGELGRRDILAVLRSTADRITELGAGLSEPQLLAKPAMQEWSMAEIVAHLALEEERVLLPRFSRLVMENNPVFDSTAGLVDDPQPTSFGAALAAFRTLRSRTLALLEALSEEAWQRPGSTPTRGTITVESYARYAAQHDLDHLDQLTSTARLVGC